MKLNILPKVLFRTPAFPVDATLKDYWESLKQSISLSSPDFYGMIKHYSADDLGRIPESVFFTVWKYFNRAKFRATPYGSFAGCGIAELSKGDSLDLIIKDELTLNAFPDWSTKDSVVCDEDGSTVKLFANSSHYVFGSVIRYLSRFDDQFQLSEIEVNDVVLKVLQTCKSPTDLMKVMVIIEPLFSSGTEAREMLQELKELQLIIDSHQPNIIGEDFFERMGYRKTDKGNDYILAQREVVSGTLPSAVVKGSAALIEALHAIKQKDEQPALDSFIKKFRKKFEMDEVPLMTALDPEAGIGYDSLENPENMDAFTSRFLPSGRGSEASKDKRSQMVYNRLCTQGTEHGSIIELDSLDLPKIKERLPLPNTFSMMVTWVNGLNWVHSIGGATANALAGRFTLAGDEFLQLCTQHSKIETKANPEVLFFDIAYIGEARVDNINRRRSIYDYQLSILNYDTSDKLLTLDDLMISVKGDEVILRSKLHNYRVIPRLSTAYNYGRSDLPVFRLLCDLQHQGLQTNLNIDLQSIAPGLDYYPRLQHGNFVLSAARWKLYYNVVSGKMNGSDDFHGLRAYLCTLGIGRYFKTGKADQTLLFDLENEMDQIAVLLLLKKEKEIYIEEADVPIESAIRDTNGRPYMAQLMFSVLHNDCIYKPATGKALQLSHNNRIISPGGEWLYFEIYCHTNRSDEIILNNLQPFLKSQERLLQKWFFIRYDENGDHLRLRLHLKDISFGYQIIGKLTKALDHEIKSGAIADILLRTYRRETERYGSDMIEAVEEHFCFDSEYVFVILNHKLSSLEKYRMCVRLMEQVAGDVKISLVDFQNMVKAFSNSLNKEHHIEAEGFSKLNAEYKAWKQSTAYLISENEQLIYNQFEMSFVAILQKCKAEDRLRMFGDLMHMHVNRLFPANQRTHEMVIYYFLSKELMRSTAMTLSQAC